MLPAGDWRVGKADGMRAEQLVERADGRPSWLVSIDELPIGENEAEPGGESFGLTTLIARVAGLRRIGVNLDVVHPGQRSCEYHWHRSEEEGFLVLAGTGWLYAGDERFRVGPGRLLRQVRGAQAGPPVRQRRRGRPAHPLDRRAPRGRRHRASDAAMGARSARGRRRIRMSTEATWTWTRSPQEVEHLLDERGGLDSVKEDALELKDIVEGDGSLVDKAKEAAEAIKDPGAAAKGTDAA